MEKHFEFDNKRMYKTEFTVAAIYATATLLFIILFKVLRNSDNTIFKVIADILFVAFLYVICDLMTGLVLLLLRKPIRTLDLHDEYFMINDDKYFYGDDSLTYIVTGRSVCPFFCVEGYNIQAFDEDSGIRKTYWAGPGFNKKHNELLKNVNDALAEMREDKASSYLDLFYKKSSSASQSHIVVTYPVALTLKSLMNRVCIFAATALVLFLISVLNVADVFLFVLIMLSSGLFIYMTVFYFKKHMFYDKNGVSSSEISPKGIRINNDFYSFDQKPVFTYSDLPDKNKKLVLLPSYKEMKVSTSDGNEKVYSLGFDHFCFREQMLMKVSIDSLLKYIEAYGIPKDL